MPVARNYTGGSIVYFQGDIGDEVYVLQKGRVILISTALDTGEEVKEEVKMGEFFGVKSSLGHYPREETAQVLGKTSVIVFKVTEFEQMVLKNTRLIMTMMRVFSKQLRDIHRQVRQILKAGAAGNPAQELLNVAEAFFRYGNFDHAIYAFQKYLEYNPNGQNVRRAEELMQMAKKGMTYPAGYPAPQHEDESEPMGAHMSNQQKMRSADQALNDPFGLPEDTGPDLDGEDRSISDVLKEGLAEFEEGNYEKALECFSGCLEYSHLSDQGALAQFRRAHYEKARTQLKLKQYEQAGEGFTNYLKKFPTGEHVKESIYALGVTAEEQGNADRARTLYHKVATMPPPDNTTREARKRLEQLGA